MSKFLFFIIFCFFLFFPKTFLGETKEVSRPSSLGGELQKIKLQLRSLKGLEGKDYILRVDGYRDGVERYIEHKKKVCEGEFSTVILSKGEKEKSVSKHLKLSKKERKICFRELKSLQENYISSMFEAKKNYMIYIHKSRLRELEKAKEEALRGLKILFTGKGSR